MTVWSTSANRERLALMLAEAGILTALSVSIGVALGLPTLLYLEIYGIELSGVSGMSIMGVAMNSSWRAELSMAAVAGPVAALVAIVAVAVTYPALKAALIDPVRAIHHR